MGFGEAKVNGEKQSHVLHDTLMIPGHRWAALLRAGDEDTGWWDCIGCWCLCGAMIPYKSCSLMSFSAGAVVLSEAR